MIAHLREIVKNIEYRPGWRLQVDSPVRNWYGDGCRFPPWDAAIIAVYAQVQDSGDPSKTTTVVHTRMLPLDMMEHSRDGEPMVVDFIYRFLLDVEYHEAAEFFQYKGAKPYDPHKGGK